MSDQSRFNRRDFLKAATVGGLTLGSVSLLNACATPPQAPAQTSAPAPSTKAPEQPAAPAPAAKAAVALRVWNNHPEWKDPFEEALGLFERQTGIDLVLEPKPGSEYVQLLNAAFQSGEAPDVPGVTAGPLLDEFLKSGYILDLQGKIHTDRLADPSRLRVTRAGGKVAGAPFGMWTVGMYYHKKIFADLKLEIPRTWDELTATCDKIKAAGKIPLMQAAKTGVIPSFYYILTTGSVLGPAGYQDLLAGKRKLTDPDIVAAVKFLQGLTPYFPEGYASIDYADGKAQFARGDIGIAVGGSADFAGYKQVNPDVDLDFFAFPAPSASTGYRVTCTGQDVIMCVNAKSKHIDEAIQLVDWFTTPEASQEFTDRIQLPTVKGVVPKQPMWARQIEEAKNQLPFMREMDECAGVWNVLTQDVQAMLLGVMTPEELSKRCQEALEASLA